MCHRHAIHNTWETLAPMTYLAKAAELAASAHLAAFVGYLEIDLTSSGSTRLKRAVDTA
jgi:hypothetical protein